MADLAEDLGRLVTQVAQRWQLQASRVLRPLGLTYGQFQLLASLERHPGFSQAAVGRQAGMDAMTASVALRNLERRRLVARRQSGADSRALLLSMTEAGAAALGKALPALAAAERAFFAGVGAARPELAAVLAGLIGQRARVRVAMGRNAPG